MSTEEAANNSWRVLLGQALDLAHGAWRFRWIGLAVAGVLSLSGWIVVLSLPDRYEASARVFVDARTAISRATEGLAMATDIDAQIERVREALLGAPQLEEVARKEGLQTAGASPRERQDAITKLRESIQINPRGDGLFVISYTDQNRQRALGVVQVIVNRFVEDSLGGKREGSEQAQHFLQQQISDYEQRLSAAEERLAEFKKKNVGMLPGAQSDYFSRLQTEMDALSKQQSDLAVAQRRRDELQRQTRGEAAVTAAPGTSRAGGAALGDNDLASRIRETQSRIDELLLNFTDKHPDVIALRATLAELKARQKAELEAFRHGDAGAAASMGLASNPVFQNVQVQLNQTDVEIAELHGKIAETQGRVASLKQLVNTAPEIEAEYARLNRDYDVTRAEYQALVQRLEQSRLSQQAEETGIVRFEVVDPPSAPYKPVAPKRPMLIIAVLLGALGASVALACLLHQLKPVFGSTRQLHEVTGLPVLGSVSMTWLERHRARERTHALLYASAASVLLVLAVGVLLTQARMTVLLRHWVG